MSGLYILLASVHGLVRSERLELGRDADTGGQVLYVVDLAKALSEHPDVARVDLLTRSVQGRNIDADYSRPVEQFSAKGFLVRIRCGPQRYLRKENLWPYMDSMVDQTLQHFRAIGRVPDIIHGHYADAGYLGAQLARLLGVPFVFTGHSLGRVKKNRMLGKGSSEESLEAKFHFKERIEAEETALDTAAFVVASSEQEVQEQYKLYDHYRPRRMVVIPPGVDLSRFSPPNGQNGLHREDGRPPIGAEVARFLRDPTKPIVLAIARPDEKKNFPTLIEAFANNEQLRKSANLVIIAGSRTVYSELTPSARKVLRSIIALIDLHDLYGSVAYPKSHTSEDVPELYRLAAASKGVFVNPAFTEPFGLTLIEAAASGLPVVATMNGGPQDIIATCDNGVLVDPQDSEEMGRQILAAISDRERWQRWSENGLKNAKQHYSWQGHAGTYLEHVRRVLAGSPPETLVVDTEMTKLTSVDRIVVASLEDVLAEKSDSLQRFVTMLDEADSDVAFCVSCNSRHGQALDQLKALGIPLPDVLIASCGAEIYYGRQLVADRAWRKHINYKWHRDKVQAALAEFPDLEIAAETDQGPFILSYLRRQPSKPTKPVVVQLLRKKGLRVNLIRSHGSHINILPIRASTSLALRYVSFKWGVPPGRILVAAASGVDKAMLTGDTLGVVVANYSPELKSLRGRPRVYFARESYAAGLIEGIEYYDFFGDIKVPSDEYYEEPGELAREPAQAQR